MKLSGKLMVELIPASPVGSRGGSMQQTDSPNEEERVSNRWAISTSFSSSTLQRRVGHPVVLQSNT